MLNITTYMGTFNSKEKLMIKNIIKYNCWYNGESFIIKDENNFDIQTFTKLELFEMVHKLYYSYDREKTDIIMNKTFTNEIHNEFDSWVDNNFNLRQYD
jgi:hypothetical protein